MRGKRAAALLVCVLLLFQMTVLPARADEPVYFLAADIEIQPVSDQTMPFWSGGYLYIPANIFTGAMRKILGVTFQYVESEQVGVLDSGSDRILIFDLKKNYTTDINGQVSYPGGLLRNGTVYVPAYLVTKYFDLEYSVIDVSQGFLVWIRQKNFGLTDREFADAASYRMASRYADYMKTKTVVETVQPEVPESGTEIDGKKIYLCMEAGDNTAMLLDVLDRYGTQAAFFCTPEFLRKQGDLLRRMSATGQTIGLLVDGADSSAAIEEQLEAGNRVLEQATCGRTRLIRIENQTDQALRAAREAGYRCLEPDIDYTGYYLRSASNAESLLKRVSDRWGDVSVWLGDRANAAGLRSFLAEAEEGDGHCLAWTETA